MRRRPRTVLVLLALALVAACVAIMPWAFHIGGRPTPFLIWFGSGSLVGNDGAIYPLFVMLHPASRFSRLALPDGTRPSGGIGGNACLCSAPGISQYLEVSGTLYGGWRSTDGSFVAFRLLEPKIVDVGQRRRGYFNLSGRWNGPELQLDDPGSDSRVFRSGLRIEHATVTLRWHPYWTCKSACESAFSRK